MPFTWQIPYQPPDPAAIERMRRAFPKPSPGIHRVRFEPLRLLWDEELGVNPIDPRDLGWLMHEIERGIEYYAQEEFTARWKAWFKYLLPDALLIVNTPREDNAYAWLFSELFRAVFRLYPIEIIDEYPGFRNDLVYTLGTRVIPEVFFCDQPPDPSSPSFYRGNALLGDIWRYPNKYRTSDEGRFLDFDLPMHFCLKYLHQDEIETWVQSLLKIDRPQWHLVFISWWITIPTSSALFDYRSCSNWDLFHQLMRKYLSREMFLTWADQIRSHAYVLDISVQQVKNKDLLDWLNHWISIFEQHFFDGDEVENG